MKVCDLTQFYSPLSGGVKRYLEEKRNYAEAAGHEPLTTQIFLPDDPYLKTDTIGAVKPALVRPLARHDGRAAMAERGVDRPFYTCEFDITLRTTSG